ncbi:hypothetical protein E2C01_040052 [Portunus trituberculatus]|uniref:Uncharacterized protein n=1 Tax=Portunus trituberculatus TaxID=210409 RepID=A0A5B7FLM8_PORTR|nr:hypothetical protein [Portunus trituberculatus]
MYSDHWKAAVSAVPCCDRGSKSCLPHCRVNGGSSAHFSSFCCRPASDRRTEFPHFISTTATTAAAAAAAAAAARLQCFMSCCSCLWCRWSAAAAAALCVLQQAQFPQATA